MTARLPGEPACRDIVEVVTDYLEGRLPLAERTKFEQHLVFCGGCKVYVEQMRQVVRTAGELREDALDPKQREDLVRLFRDWKAKK